MEAVSFVQKQGLAVLYLDAHLDDEKWNQVPELLMEKIGLPGTAPLKAVVIDFKNDKGFSQADWIRLQKQLQLVPGAGSIYLIQLPTQLKGALTQKKDLRICNSVDEVFADLSKGREGFRPQVVGGTDKSPGDREMEAAVVSALQKGFIHTMKVQCATDFKSGARLTKGAGNRPNADIASTMGIMSKSISGAVALEFTEKGFLEIMGKMLGETYSEVGKDLEDGCAELLNIIFGQAHRILADDGYKFGKTLPSVLFGPALKVRDLTPQPSILLPFESSLGIVHLEFGYRKI